MSFINLKFFLLIYSLFINMYKKIYLWHKIERKQASLVSTSDSCKLIIIITHYYVINTIKPFSLAYGPSPNQ
jgi:hypothetical protein